MTPLLHIVRDGTCLSVLIWTQPFLTRTLKDYDLIYVKKCDENYTYEFKEASYCPNNVQVIANGEFSIECVLRKGNKQVYAEEQPFFKGE